MKMNDDCGVTFVFVVVVVVVVVDEADVVVVVNSIAMLPVRILYRE
jgi:hypothetical protein